MANVVDELVVVLGLDATQFSEGQKRALESFKKTRDDATLTAKELEARGKQGGMFFGEINRQAVGLIATLVGAGSLEKYLAGTVPQIAALGRVAQVMGQSAPDLKAFQLFVQQMGGNADVATGSFLKLSETMQNFRSGMAIPDPTFLLGLSTIGGNINDTPIQLFEKFAAWTKGKTGPQSEQEGQRLGLDDGTIQAAIRAGPEAAKDLADQKANLPSDADIKRVQDLQIAFFKLRQDIVGSANAMLYQAAPALTNLLNLVDQGVAKFPGLTKALLGIATALTAIGLVKIPGTILRMLVGGVGVGAAEGAGVAGAVGVGELAAPAVVTGGILLLEKWMGEKLGEAVGKAIVGDSSSPSRTSGGVGVTTATPERVAAIAHAAGLPPHVVKAIVDGAAPKAGWDLTLADKYNNPGNLTDPKTGKFRHFATREEGYAAMARQELIDYNVHGQRTLYDLIDDPHHGWSNEWAPGNNHASAMSYIARLSKDLGIGAHDQYQMTPEFLANLMLAQTAVERGGAPLPGSRDIATRAAQITIGSITVVAGGVTDARGVAKHLKTAIAHELATQSNGALN